MTNEEWKKSLSKKLVEVFGKNVFSEDDFTSDFYIELRIRCSD